MKKTQKILALVLAVLFLASSIMPGMVPVTASETGGTEQTETQSLQAAAETETPQTDSGTESEGETAGQTETEAVTEVSGETETSANETETDSSADKNDTQQEETDETETGSVATGKTARATGVTISSADDPALAALIPDDNFRAAVYKALESYGWLSGDKDNPPESVQEILETYRGGINARGCEIESIEGIQYFKVATTAEDGLTIDLSNNSITDMMPIFSLCTTGSYYYGGTFSDRNGLQNVNINLVGNPWMCFPDPANSRWAGYLSVSDINQNASEIVDSDDLQYYYLRTSEKKTFSGYMQIGYCHYEDLETGEYVPISEIDLDGTPIEYTNLQASEMHIESTDEGDNKDADADIYYSNLTKSGTRQIGVVLNNIIRVRTASSGTGLSSYKWTSMTYVLNPTFTIFDHVTTSGTSGGSANVKKVDEVTGEAVAGAEFSLYKVVDGVNDTLIASGLTSGTDGYTDTVEDLENGEYYFIETDAPNGYTISTGGYNFTVGYSVAVSGGLKTLSYTSADGSTVSAQAGETDTYITTGMKEDVDFYIKDADGNNIGDADNLVSKVTVTYASLDGSTNSVTEEYSTLAEAEDALNAYIDANQITGEVSVAVTYNNTAISTSTVEVADSPAVDVKVEKTWEGLSTDDTLPEVTYTLYRTGSGSAETVASYTVAAGSAEDDYTYTFTNLPRYEKTNNGYVEYEYTVTETITQNGTEYENKYSEGDVGDASDPVEQSDGSLLITIPVTNYRKASVIIKKSDASGDRSGDLKDVEFKLEKQVTDSYGNTSWEEVEIGGESRYYTDSDGNLEIKWLDFGTYRLTETGTWAGYILLADPIEFTISKDKISSPNEYVYMISNSAKYNVPNAGGIGNILFLLGGGFILLAGGIWGYRRRFYIRQRRG